MKCQLIKSEYTVYTIKPADHDFLDDYSVEVDVDESLIDDMLDVQHKYRKLQKKLKELDNAEKLSR